MFEGSQDVLCNNETESNPESIDHLHADVVVESQFSGELYLPNTPVIVKITGVNESEHSVGDAQEESGPTTHHYRRFRFLDSSWYLIKVVHGRYEWTIKKTITEFEALNRAIHNQLRVRILLTMGRGKRIHLPYFPSKLDILFRGKMAERKGILEEYLQGVMGCEVLRTMDAVIKFFEISPVSFYNRLGLTKWKEDSVYKLSSNRLLPLCCMVKLCRQPRWLVLKDSYLLYMKRVVKTDQSMDSEEMDIDQALRSGALIHKVKRQWRLCKVLLMDQAFAFVKRVEKNTSTYFLKIYNKHGRLVVLCQSEWHLQNWIDELTAVMQTAGARDYVDDNRFGSFAPPRPDTHFSVFVDGACYMEAVAKAIAQARFEIFITDWCMNPEIFLRRPGTSNTWRLDKLLQAKAQQGVRICIMLYNGIEGIVPFSSVLTARYLHGLHSNIHVYLSPVRIMFWSHHEKMVAIDQSVVFMGGIDLCYGRWDTVDHRLQDVPKLSPTPTPLGAPTNLRPFSTIDPRKDRISSISTDAPRYHKVSMQRQTPPRKVSAWRIPKPFTGKNLMVQDRRSHRPSDYLPNEEDSIPDPASQRRFSRMFQQAGKKLHAILSKKSTKSHHQVELDVVPHEDPDLMYLEAEWNSHKEESGAYTNFGFEGEEDVQLEETEITDLDQLCELGSRCTWVGQDYVNWAVAEPTPKLHPADDTVNRLTTPRMPWHDIGCVLSGRIAADFSRHFIQRWNAIRNSRIKSTAKGTAERAKRRRKPLLLPSYRCAPWTETALQTILNDPRQSSVVQAQALRSCTNWSLGVPPGNTRKGTRHEFRQFIKGAPPSAIVSNNVIAGVEIGLEASIVSAYVDCILEAKRFIYIENQFFISFLTLPDEELDGRTRPMSTYSDTSLGDFDPYHLLPRGTERTVKNRLVDALYLRILKAHRDHAPFRVYILLPLIPGFTGTYGDPKSHSQHKILYYLRLSLFVGNSALLPRLRQSQIDPENYVSICGLRTYDEWPGGDLKSEIIYIHSKFMVVDDCKMIVGSANINDRSLRGKRDSELAVLIENNPVGPYAQLDICPYIRRVRRSLMAEHLGVLPKLERCVQGEWPDEMLNDPVSDKFFNNIWKATAEKNAHIFEEVFNVIPANNLKTFNDCRQHREKVPLAVTDPGEAKEKLKHIRGSLVTFPIAFLEHEDLQSRDAAVENVAPAIIWT